MTRTGDEMTAQHTFGSRGSADTVPLGWGVYEQPPLVDGDPDVVVWWCFSCESGTGQAPTYKEAHQAAATHRRSNHSRLEK